MLRLRWGYWEIDIQEEESSHELANHGDEMIAGSLREALEEFDGFGTSHVFGFFPTREKSREESRLCLKVFHGR